MRSAAISIAAVVAITAGSANCEDSRRERDERTLRSLESRARRLPRPAAGDETGRFLMHETGRLKQRIRAARRDSYELRRLLEALDDLLDARQNLTELIEGGDSRKDRREETARRLEQAYFRVQQGEYFGGLSGDPGAAEYIRRSRQLYQQARSAWDRKEYRAAVKLASASSELINVLENLAQAAVRRPDPPVLK